MKRFLFLFTIFCVLKVNAQNYLIDFAGAGASTTVNTVKVENLTAGTSLILNGTDILHLVALTTGVTSVENIQSSELKIFPNPMKYNTVIQFVPPSEGNAVISVIDIAGKVVIQYHDYLENYLQEFRLSGLKSGFYIILVNGGAYQISGKLLCNGATEKKLSLERIAVNQKSGKQSERKVSRGMLSTVDMDYSAGDRLKFTGISGDYRTIFVDIPTGDKTIVFDFITCTIDSYSYPVVKIGDQIWMGENLKTTLYNDNTQVPYAGLMFDWRDLTTPGYCWFNGIWPPDNPFGALYNKWAVNTGKLCPVGWHIPSDSEWETLILSLGGNTTAKLRETGFSHWAPYVIVATNESGFTALPAGYRFENGGYCNVQSNGSPNNITYWWSSANTDWFISYGYGSDLYHLHVPDSDINHNKYGRSVRCLLGEQNVAITTAEVSSITTTSAISGGNLTIDFGASISARGVCWSTSAHPTIADNHSSDGTGTGIYSSLLTGLALGTKYYVRAYATKGIETSYGDERSFTTKSLPILTTTAITGITLASASTGGNISYDGGATVTARGVCWSTTTGPTILDSKTSKGSGTGSFVSHIGTLEINTEYYIRAYATNSFGTSYGNEITCTLWLNQPGPQVTDADGNIYNSIKIGNQIWMKENLGTTHYRDGISAIPLVTTDEAWDNLSTPGYCWYNNDEDFKSIYGALYNWQTVGTGNLCPTGWHVPTDAEWTTLTTYLGGEMVAGGKLKETGTTHWNSPNAGATNQSGFTALPGGMRSGGGTGGMFRIMGMYSNWWTSTEKNGGAVGRGISETEFNVFSFSSFMGNGCSIRCLKDN